MLSPPSCKHRRRQGPSGPRGGPTLLVQRAYRVGQLVFFFPEPFPGNPQPQPFPDSSIKAVGRCSFQTYPRYTPGQISESNKPNVKYLSKTSSGSDMTGFASVPQREGGSHAVNITMCCSGVRSPETPDWQQQQRDADCGDHKGGLDFSHRTGLHVFFSPQ